MVKYPIAINCFSIDLANHIINQYNINPVQADRLSQRYLKQHPMLAIPLDYDARSEIVYQINQLYHFTHHSINPANPTANPKMTDLFMLSSWISRGYHL